MRSRLVIAASWAWSFGVVLAEELIDKIYWTNFQTKAIMRANLADGSGTEQVHGSDTVSLPWGLAIHPSSCSLYWADVASKSIMRSDLDGSSTSIFLVLDEAPLTFWLAPGDDLLYWTQRNGKIFRISLVTSGATAEERVASLEELVTSYSGYYYNRFGIAVDRSQDPPHVFVSETEEWVISKQTWGTEEGDAWWVEEWENIWAPESLAIDESTREIYWVDKGYRDIRKASLDGGDSSVQVVMSGLEAPRGLALNGDKLYFIHWGIDEESSVVQADLSGNVDWRIAVGSKAGPAGLAVMNATLVSGCSSSDNATIAGDGGVDEAAETEITTSTVFT